MIGIGISSSQSLKKFPSLTLGRHKNSIIIHLCNLIKNVIRYRNEEWVQKTMLPEQYVAAAKGDRLWVESGGVVVAVAIGDLN